MSGETLLQHRAAKRSLGATFLVVGLGLAAIPLYVQTHVPYESSTNESFAPGEFAHGAPSSAPPAGRAVNRPAVPGDFAFDDDAFVSVAEPGGPAAKRLVIQRIGLDADVVEVALDQDEWQVPTWVVGHLAETVNPGEIGNAVFAGHLVAGGRGNVFARLNEARPGDELIFATGAGEERFRVSTTRLVSNTDTTVLARPSDRPMVTLMTCAGRWLPWENDYDQRLIVVAERNEITS